VIVTNDKGESMTRSAYAVVILAAALGVAGTACSSSDSATKTTTAASSSAASSSAAAASPVDNATLPTLVPAPAGTQNTKGPDGIADNGIHLRFQVSGAPADVMNAYKAALGTKGWAVTTVVTSGGGGGGGATYTGTNGAAFGVFDGGGYQDKTWVDVCAWPTKPADPNCVRGG
jgi:hypothetical protein